MPNNLTERIRNGSGEDRELDWEIHNHFWRHAPDYLPGKGSHPDYCTDLNAVFALVERELPKVHTKLEGPDRDGFHVAQLWPEPNHGAYEAWASDRCRALLLALLAAKEQRT